MGQSVSGKKILNRFAYVLFFIIVISTCLIAFNGLSYKSFFCALIICTTVPFVTEKWLKKFVQKQNF